MTDEELNQKMERVTSKKVTRQPKRRKSKGKKQNSYQLWAQLNEEQLRKLGYIK